MFAFVFVFVFLVPIYTLPTVHSFWTFLLRKSIYLRKIPSVNESIFVTNQSSSPCKDSKGKVLVKNHMRRCRWISYNFPKACYNSKEVRNHCKRICNACPGFCADMPGEFMVAGQTLTCETKAKTLRTTRCKNRVFSLFCPVTCGRCPTSSSLAPSISLEPTLVGILHPSIAPTLESSFVDPSPTLAPTLTPVLQPFQVVPEGWVTADSSIYGSMKDSSGLAVSLSSDGKSLFIGEPGAGLVRSFTSKLERLEAKGLPMGDSYDPWFGASVASSRDGSVVVIGCYKCNNYRGLVRSYVWDGNRWIKLGNDLEGDKYGDWFGWDVDISDNGRSIVVGVYVENSTRGYASVYDINPNGWKKRGEGFSSDMPLSFGFSVAISSDGNIIAIGAPKGDYTEIYEWSLDHWSIIGNRIHGSIGSHFGNSVALSSKNDLVLAVGAELSNVGQGAVFVFVWSRVTKKWQMRGNDSGIHGDEYDNFFGRRLSISEDGNVVAYSSRTKVGISVWDGLRWEKQGIIIVNNTASISLSGDGNTLALGMPHDEAIGFRSGTTTIFKRSLGKP